MPTAVQPTDLLAKRLNDPKVAEGLNRLLDRLDTVSFAVESVDEFMRRGDVIADSVADSVADFRGDDAAGATELLEKAPRLIKTGSQLADAATHLNIDELTKSKVLERLTDPQTLATLNELLDKLPLVAFLLTSIDEFIRRGETIADSLAAAVGELKLNDQQTELSKLPELLEKLPKLAEAGEKLLDSELMGDGFLKVIDAGVGMVDSGMMDKDVVRTLGDLGRKSVETYHEVASREVAPIGGIFATMKATRDPDVQKSMGFFFAFAKAFAKHL